MRTFFTLLLSMFFLELSYGQYSSSLIDNIGRDINIGVRGSCASPDGIMTEGTGPGMTLADLQANGNCTGVNYTFGGGNQSATFCFSLVALYTYQNFGAIVTHNCGTGNMSFSNITLYNSGCTVHGTGTSYTNLTVGATYIFCFTASKSGSGCDISDICPYFYDATPAPIKISQLNVLQKNENNIIQWITASEINNQWQIVEKSADGISNWTEVDRVSGSMSSDGNRSYEVIDHKPFGLTYYRIHSIDYDGFEEFSDIVYARSNNFATDNNVQIVPNPTSGHINVLYYSSTDTELAVTITDASGRKFYTEKNQILKGENAKGIDVSNLTSGLYFLQTELDGKVSNKRFVKY